MAEERAAAPTGLGARIGGAGAASLARRIFAGTGVITAASTAVRALAIVSAPVLTTLLGPVAYGEAALVSTLTALLGTVALLGIDMSYARYYFGGVSDDASAVERLCWRTALAASAVLSIVGVLVWVLVLAPRTGTSPALAAIVAAGGLLTVATTLSQTRARLRGRYTRLGGAILIGGLVGTGAMIALAALWRQDSWALLVGTAVGTAAGIAVSGVPGIAELLRPSGLPPAARRSVLALGLPGVGTALMYWVLSSADRWVIAWYLPPAVLGSYAFAANLGLVGLMLKSAVMMVWFPEAARAYEQDPAAAPAVLGRLWGRMVTLLGVVWLAVTMSGGDVLRLLADRRFHDGAAYIPWIAGGVFFYGLASIGATGMVLMKDQRPQALWWLVGMVVSAGLNLALVPRYGAMAAAVANCAGFAVIAAGVLWVSERWLPLRIAWGRVAVALLATMLAGVAGAPAWSAHPLASLGMKLPVGLVVAALTLALVAPDWTARLLRRVRPARG